MKYKNFAYLQKSTPQVTLRIHQHSIHLYLFIHTTISMYVGQSCLVRYPIPGYNLSDKMFEWHKATILSVKKDTVSVIWQEGEWVGRETYGLRKDTIIVTGIEIEIQRIKSDIQELKMNTNNILCFLQSLKDEVKDLKKPFVLEDMVNYGDIRNSLKSLELDSSIEFSDPNENRNARYFS